jgi:Amt family ammonium transporter
MDSGHIAWMLVASALVLFMTPGLAFFYGGLVRAKNVVSTIMYSFMSMAVVSIVWILWGYSLAFGDSLININGSSLVGNFEFFALGNIGAGGDGIPDLLFVVFQMMFAIITPALITGAFAERFKFSTYLLFLILWVTLVYAPICHWVWASDGWLFKRGALDFAGGTVVHLNAGMAAVAAAWLVGKRRGPTEGRSAHNVPFVVLGASILWFGWFGFNAGSGLASNFQAVNAFLVTNTAAASAMLTWTIIGYIQTNKFSAVGSATGAVAGLVAITPASGFVDAKGALVIGITVAIVCYFSAKLMEKSRLDDALVVFGVHGVGGLWGALLTGVFALEVIGGTKGLLEGNGSIMIEQIVAVLATGTYSLVATLIILKILDIIPGLGLQVAEQTESAGLDVSEHGERGYVQDGAD